MGFFGSLLSGGASAVWGMITGTLSDQLELQAALDAKMDNSEKGAASGVCPLDGGSKVAAAYLPNTVMEYQGAWDASTNTPSLADGAGNAGDIYRASVAGTQDLGSGSQTWAIGDLVIYSGTVWQKAPAADGVSSVNTKTGAVVLDYGDVGAEQANANIQSHISDTSSNPHSVTASQAGAAPAALVEAISAHIVAPEASTVVLDRYAAYAYTINSLIGICTAGSVNIDIQIDGTPVTGIDDVAVDTSEDTYTASAANSVAVGATVSLVINSASSAENFNFTLKTTRS